MSTTEATRRGSVPRRGSLVWRYFGDARGLLLAAPTLVMQVAHPVVGAGVLDHSNFRADPWPRLGRTLLSLWTLIYGGPRASMAEADRLRAMHRAIRGVDASGHRYHALDPEAYAWVHATLVYAVVDAQSRFGRPLGPAELTRYYAETRALGRVLGLRDQDLPPTWADFRAYYDDKVATRLTANQAVYDVLDSTADPAKPRLRYLPDPLWRLVAGSAGRFTGLITVGTLRPVLRERLSLPWTETDDRRLHQVQTIVRRATTPIPGAFLRAPAITTATLATRRTSGNGGS